MAIELETACRYDSPSSESSLEGLLKVRIESNGLLVLLFHDVEAAQSLKGEIHLPGKCFRRWPSKWATVGQMQEEASEVGEGREDRCKATCFNTTDTLQACDEDSHQRDAQHEEEHRRARAGEEGRQGLRLTSCLRSS